MKETEVERYVSDLLTVSGLSADGEERRLWTLLHHLYCAVSLWTLATDEERAEVEDMRKRLRYFFSSEVKLKERKRKNNEKEKVSPAPPLKEKEKEKEKAEKMPVRVKRVCEGDDVLSLNAARREEFRQQCLAYVGKYDAPRLADFFNYWSETTRTTGKMRFERQRYWNLEKRLARWMNNQYAAAATAAAIRLRKARKRQADEAAAEERDRNAAAEREQANRQRETNVEEGRREKGGLEDVMTRNPDGLLARLQRERQKKENPKDSDKTT